MRTMAKLAVALLLGLACAGCDDDLPEPTLISGTRMLGSRVEVDGDATRSAPRPGETALVTFPLVGPRPGVDPKRIHSLLIHCTFPNRYTGIPICQEILDVVDDGVEGLESAFGGGLTNDLRFECEADEGAALAGVGFACIQGLPTIQVPIGDSFEGDAKLIRGVVCDGGTPYFDPLDPALFGCVGGDETILMYDSIQVSRDAETDNTNPAPDAMSLEINGLDWERVELDIDQLDPDNCAEWAAAEGLPELDPFAHEILFQIAPETMEKVAGGREALDVEAFATAGEVGRRYTIFDERRCDRDGDGDDDRDEDDDPLCDRVTWTGAGIERPNETGTLVDFYFTLRDRRGGFVLTHRTACIFTLAPAG